MPKRAEREENERCENQNEGLVRKQEHTFYTAEKSSVLLCAKNDFAEGPVFPLGTNIIGNGVVESLPDSLASPRHCA